MLDEAEYESRYKDLTIKPVTLTHIDYETDSIIAIMGPTGAGKSSFIEALAGDKTLNISKDQLDGCTQTIATYEVLNVARREGSEIEFLPDRYTTYVIDTPGFSDSQISEMEIVKMMNEWMESLSVNIHTIIYICPISDTRLSGSKRRTLRMLKALTGIDTNTPGTVFVVTSMWDRIWNIRGQLAADERFAQLRDDIWKDLPHPNLAISKFLNTHQSAIDVINSAFRFKWIRENTSGFDALDTNTSGLLQDAPFVPHLYGDLLDRIHNTQQQIQGLEMELGEREVQANAELRSLLEVRLQKSRQLLQKFETQLIEFGDPPPGFEGVAVLRQALVEKHRKRDAFSFKRVLYRGINSVKAKIKRKR